MIINKLDIIDQNQVIGCTIDAHHRTRCVIWKNVEKNNDTRNEADLYRSLYRFASEIYFDSFKYLEVN